MKAKLGYMLGCTCAAAIGILIGIQPVAAQDMVPPEESCFDFPTPSGRTYVFSLSEFGVVTPTSDVEIRSGGTTRFIVKKQYAEPSQTDFVGEFDSCEAAEIFVKRSGRDLTALREELTRIENEIAARALAEDKADTCAFSAQVYCYCFGSTCVASDDPHSFANQVRDLVGGEL
jgi:hypothetical protein